MYIDIGTLYPFSPNISLVILPTVCHTIIEYNRFSHTIDLAKPRSGTLISLFSSPTLHWIKTVIKLSTGKSLCQFGGFGIGSTNNPLIDIFLYSRYLSAWFCIDVVKGNSLLVTYRSERVNCSNKSPHEYSEFLLCPTLETRQKNIFLYNVSCLKTLLVSTLTLAIFWPNNFIWHEVSAEAGLHFTIKEAQIIALNKF